MKFVGKTTLTKVAIGTFGLILGLASCQQESQVDTYTKKNVLIIGNSSEPQGLDPHVVSGVTEGNIIRGLFEGLCLEDPKLDGVSLPGAAIKWEHNKEYTKWTFQLQPNGKWSDGEPVTTEDFKFAYHRILTPDFMAEYASMLYYIKGAEDYSTDKRSKILANHYDSIHWEEIKNVNTTGNKSKNYKKVLSKQLFSSLTQPQKEEYLEGKGLDSMTKEQLVAIRDQKLSFKWPEEVQRETQSKLLNLLIENHGKDLWDIAKVGVTSTGSHTLHIELRAPFPFLPEVTKHYTWFPIPKHQVLKDGSLYDSKASAWTKPNKMVSNGPFKLTAWQFNDFIEISKNDQYWDADHVSLSGVRYLPISNPYTEARMFFAGELHKTDSVASEMIDYAKKKHPENLRVSPYLGCTFLRFNLTHSELSDIDLRKALSYSIDSESMIKYIFKGGEIPATGIVPPMKGYNNAGIVKHDPKLAKAHLEKYLAKSGKSVEDIKIVLLTVKKDTSKTQAEAYKDMWIRNLGIDVSIEQAEWATYLSRMSKLNYGISTAGWIGDFPDPTTFLDMWKTGDGNNRTGWSSKEYEALLAKAEREEDPTKRFRILEQAEQLFINDFAIAPVCWRTAKCLIHKDVKGYYPLLLNNHPYKFIKLSK